MRADLKEARKAKGITQAEMALMLGKTQGVISRYETGHYVFDAKTAMQISKILELDVLKVLYPEPASKKKKAA